MPKKKKTVKGKVVNIQVPIKKLKIAEWNPRTLKEKRFKALCKSIKNDPDFMKLRPILAAKDGTIYGGNMRYRACVELGWKEVPAVLSDIPEKLAKERAIKDNNQFGEWDDSLATIIDELEKDGIDIDQLGLDEYVQNMLDELNKPEVEEDEAPPLPKKAKSKLGDLYQLGNHRLLCGDATKIEDVERLMDGEKADMVFTDPPYNADYRGSMNSHGKDKRDGIQNDKMSDIAFSQFLNDSINNMLSSCDGVFYICMSSKELSSLKRAFEDNGGHWQSSLIWVKNTFTLSRSDWQSQYEPILYGWNSRNKNHYFRGMRDECNVWENIEVMKPDYDGEFTTIKMGAYHLKLYGKIRGKVCKKKDCVDIFYEKKSVRSVEHPTMKPILLISKALKASSKKNQIVLDTFGGSGSTLIACEQLNRKCYMMEIDPKYIDVIIERWQNLIGKKAKKL